MTSVEMLKMVRNRPMMKVENLALDEIYNMKESSSCLPGKFGLSNWEDGVIVCLFCGGEQKLGFKNVKFEIRLACPCRDV